MGVAALGAVWGAGEEPLEFPPELLRPPRLPRLVSAARSAPGAAGAPCRRSSRLLRPGRGCWSDDEGSGRRRSALLESEFLQEEVPHLRKGGERQGALEETTNAGVALVEAA